MSAEAARTRPVSSEPALMDALMQLDVPWAEYSLVEGLAAKLGLPTLTDKTLEEETRLMLRLMSSSRLCLWFSDSPWTGSWCWSPTL